VTRRNRQVVKGKRAWQLPANTITAKALRTILSTQPAAFISSEDESCCNAGISTTELILRDAFAA